ncbi:MAG: SulP family inorganic anion transporter, partial [Actinomycetota bacterium]|nr:SulP family inorganic anion transporter [Actinomycetota bacterium]
MLKNIRSVFRKETLKDDTVAGLVLGVESVPDGLAGGLLAGVNPVYGLYAYMVGTSTGGLVMAIVILVFGTAVGYIAMPALAGLLQPYGSLFFASASIFEEKLPNVTDETHNSV